MRRCLVLAIGITMTVFIAGPALACGGLVNPNGTVNLLRTSTFVGYVQGVEHYVTSFEFAGQGAEFGSIVPLPGIPTKVRRAGDWTLQRLVQEVTPVARSVAFAEAAVVTDAAEVILETRIDALDITILRGGGDAVGEWAKANGFSLTPDAPEVLDYYASRSPVFMAARFDPSAAQRQGQGIGDGTPIHLTIPTDRPWVPLRILTLGLGDRAQVEADVFLLTEEVPGLLPSARPETGMSVERSEAASAGLLSDLRSDKGMDWLPADNMWLTYVGIDTQARNLRHDLDISLGGAMPDPVRAGLVAAPFDVAPPGDDETVLVLMIVVLVVAAAAIGWRELRWSA